MANQATVTSIDDLERFRASLIVFSEKAHAAIDEVLDEVRRTQNWLRHEQRTQWQTRQRKGRVMLAQAEQELLGARMLDLREKIAIQNAEVAKWKASLAEAEEKLRAVRKWTQHFDAAAGERVRGLNGLRNYLDQDLPKAIASLVQILRTLQAYAETGGARPEAGPDLAGDETEPPAQPSPDDL